MKQPQKTESRPVPVWCTFLVSTVDLAWCEYSYWTRMQIMTTGLRPHKWTGVVLLLLFPPAKHEWFMRPFVDRFWSAGNFEPSKMKTNSSTDSEPANDRCEDSLNSMLEFSSSQRILLHNINILIGFVLYILYGTKPITLIKLDVPANRKESAAL